MRYQARWSNGCWKVFDRFTFADVATRGTQRDADYAAREFSAAELRPRRFAGGRR
jgi:hypothetical protein